MFLIAQYIQAPAGDGINSFLYLHGRDADWRLDSSVPPGIDEGPGRLMQEQINRDEEDGEILSILDVAAPDDASPVEVIGEAIKLIKPVVLVGKRLPVIASCGGLWARFSTVDGDDWERQLRWLSAALMSFTGGLGAAKLDELRREAAASVDAGA